ncbi:MAG: sulfite exporter TauE/SafE family protein [Flavobacteriales bacterium]|nr:sulfite exporter TauE/SafE family protein [Flavobacteriales bacterium]
MEIIGYISAILIGLSLGLIGGGGSILTVPILVYLLGVEAADTAPAYSLFVVGTASLIGASIKYKQGFVDIKTAIVFGLPAIVSVYVTRRFLVPEIPDEIFTLENFIFTKRLFVMGLFATLMILASVSMIKGRKKIIQAEERKFNYPLILIEGVLVGILTGLVGAGGGFIIIPALVMLSNLPMKMAIGTSLAIIAAKSLFGFLGDLSIITIDWKLLLSFTSLAVAGIFIGNKLSHKIDGSKLKKGFGWFVLIMGVIIIFKETLIQ